MTRRPSSRSAAVLGAVFALTLLALFVVRARPLDAQGQGAANEFYDSHFHLTNYIQKGIDVRQFLRDHGRRASADRRSSASRCSSSGRTPTRATSRRPTTCRPTRRSTTTRSPTPTSPASIARCSPAEQARFDPMITGFNPADMYGVDHIRRVLRTSPASSPASASSASTRSSSRPRSPARPPASRIPRSIASSTSPPKPAWSSSCTTTSTCRSPRRTPSRCT